jgi:methyl-accepting chemotaxis protein
MKSTTKHRKFKNFFISKDLQRPIIIAHLAYILLAAVVLIGTVLSPFYTDMFEAGDLWAKRASANMFVILLDRLSIAGIFIMVISLFHFVILTHKFCGPLVNIGKTIARMSEKDFTRKINLRKGDFLKNEAKQINAMMMTLSDSIEIIKKENHLLLEDIAESIKAQGKQTGIDATLGGFHDRADRCRVQLDHFQLIGERLNNTGIDQPNRQHLVNDKLPSASQSAPFIDGH